jgi:hypothetical protein
MSIRSALVPEMAVAKVELKQACLEHLKKRVCCFVRFVSE